MSIFLHAKNLQTNNFRKTLVDGNGEAFLSHLASNTEHKLELHDRYEDNLHRMHSKYLYLKPNPISMADISQNITTPFPPEDNPNLAVNVPVHWKVYPNRAWIGYWEGIKDIIKTNKQNGVKPVYDEFITKTIPESTTNHNYSKSQIAPNGKIYSVSHQMNKIGIFSLNPNLTGSDSIVYESFTIPTASDWTWRNISLLPNNKLILIAYAYTKIGIFDYNTSTYSEPFTVAFRNYTSAIEIGNGQIALTPQFANSFDIYDPIRGTITALNQNDFSIDSSICWPIFHPFGGIFAGACEDQSYAAVFVKFDGYDGNGYSCTKFGTGEAISGKFLSSITLYDERVLMLPYNTNRFEIADLRNLTTVKVGDTLPNPDKNYCGGCLLPDGRVMLVPMVNEKKLAIFDPDDNSLTRIGPDLHDGTKWCSECLKLMPDGSVMLIPRQMNYVMNIRVSGGYPGLVPSLEQLCSVYLND